MRQVEGIMPVDSRKNKTGRGNSAGNLNVGKAHIM